MSEEENLPTAEEMRARYADLMKDDAPAEDEATGDRPQATETEPEAPQAAVEEPAPAPETPAPDTPTPDTPAAPAPVPDLEPVDEPPEIAEDLVEHLLDVNVRLWAELGRARLPLAQTVALGSGAIVDLDKEPEDELDVLVNGMPFAKGKLLLVDGEWAIRLERIVATPASVEQASSSGSGA